jgi:hypothetical protein
MSDYTPGTVAIATVRGVKGVKVLRGVDGNWSVSSSLNGQYWHGGETVTDIRPLVVLDPDSDLMRRFMKFGHQGCSVSRDLREEIAAQIKSPRIPEPGLYGVVSARLTEECQAENRKGPLAGDFIHSANGLWQNVNTGFGVTWLELDNPVLVREGVQS